MQHLRGFFTTTSGEISVSAYFALGALSFALTYLFTLALIKLAPRIGAVDIPDTRRIHREAVPRLGGLAIFLALALALVFAGLINQKIAADLLTAKSIATFVGLGIMLVLGMYDDLFGASWMLKFTFQVVAACIVIGNGLVIIKVTNPLGPTIELPVLAGLIFTVIWLVGITNAVNLSDGLDDFWRIEL